MYTCGNPVTPEVAYISIHVSNESFVVAANPALNPKKSGKEIP